jgi:hypothetical protein
MRNNPISTNKQKLIDEKNNSPLEVGELLIIGIFPKSKTVTIDSLEGGIFVFDGYASDRGRYTSVYKIEIKDITSRHIRNIGANPFDETHTTVRPVAFCFDSILFGLDILGDKRENKNKYKVQGIEVIECNWNPFIYNKEGKKEFYQRPFVWALKDKQLLIESIYQNIDCGKILVRKRSFDELEKLASKGETELAFFDLVDGKQRLNAMRSFLLDEFQDLQGNYYSDLSAAAQNKITSHQLFSYAEMSEGTKDEDVIRQFLKLNFAGVPQSIEHIEFVKSLLIKL